MIRFTNQLTDKERKEAKALIASCQANDHTFREPYLSNMLNFDPTMPTFFLYYQEGELLGLLTVYADNEDVEVAILVVPDYRRKGIARSLFDKFQKETASYPIQSVTFQTERIFLDCHPDFISHWGLVEDADTETWLGRGRQTYALDSHSDVKSLLADISYLEEIAQLHHQAFSDVEETLEVSLRYIAEALKDFNSLLYILLKEGQVIGLCTVDLSGNSNYLYGLAVAEGYRGQGYGSYLAKSVVNQLIAHNDKSFQIAVEDDNVGAKHLYEKIGFVKQTQVVYLKQKE